jgi:hypothetical protein
MKMLERERYIYTERERVKLWWFVHVKRRHTNFVVRRLDQMADSRTTRGRGKSRETIKKILRLMSWIQI